MTKADEIRAEHAHRNATIITDIIADIRGDLMASQQEVTDLKAERDSYRKALEQIRDYDELPITCENCDGSGNSHIGRGGYPVECSFCKGIGERVYPNEGKDIARNAIEEYSDD